MSWLILVLAGCAEVSGVISMKLSKGFTKWKPSLAALISGGFSFYLLSLALQEIPIGTAYAIWAGIGAAGSVLIGMLLFQESRAILRILFLACVVIGVVGLKVVAPE